ncbi:tyrosine-type recombinase/integrase [Streptomyces sp. NPDC059063]|uniref:tyrosine-type recombinase/integrase n=1 Tax=unclassified Streptomyces TaxID=2593676 RepID=UPI003690FC07
MAYVQERKRADGEVSYTVRWRAGGSRGGKNESEVFSERPAADRFRDLVAGHGEQWPPGWIRGRGFIQDLRGDDEMFEPFAMKYIELLTGVGGDTRSRYKRFVQRNMTPWFKNFSVRDGEGGISREQIQQWINDLEAGRLAPHDPLGMKRVPCKPKMISNNHGLLYGILQAAVIAEPPLRASNPCAYTRLPRQDDEIEEEMTFLERDEWALIYACLAEDAKDLAEAFAETGGRWGEITALQPRDLRRRNGQPAIRIQRAWKRDEDGQPYLGAPKTKKSRRTVVITHKLDRMLRRRAQGLAPDDLLFTGPNGGRWDGSTFRRLRWAPALELAAMRGLTKRPRLHDLRHSHAAWLIAARVPLPAIQARLGHESITTTIDRYGHLLDALDHEIVAAVEWAMDPTAPLPGFLRHSGLATSPTAHVSHAGPDQSLPASEGAVDVYDPGTSRQISPVFLAVLDNREVPFASRTHAQFVIDQWNDDHAVQVEEMRAAGWPEEKVLRKLGRGPEERVEWTGGGPVWTRIPDRQHVHYLIEAFSPDGSTAYEPLPLLSTWAWEFEADLYTTESARSWTSFRPGAQDATTEAHALGINRAAVLEEFQKARNKARSECSRNPYLRRVPPPPDTSAPDGQGCPTP